MNKLRKIVVTLLFTLTIYFLNIDKIFAADSIGIKVQIKDAMGGDIQNAYILRNENPYFATNYGSYTILDSLPYFNNDDGSNVLSDYILNESNINLLLNVIGSTFSLEQMKSNNYVINISGIYGGVVTPEYNYYVETCTTGEVPTGAWCTLCCTKRASNGACQLYQYAKGACLGTNTTDTCYYENEASLRWSSMSGFSEMKNKTTCNSNYTYWTTSNENSFKASLNSNQKIISSKTKTRYIDNYQIIYAATTTFNRTDIEQAELCGEKSVYKDTVSIENAIGSSYFLDENFGNKEYCPVYCTEEDTFTWPGFKPTAQMGGHFTWTIGNNDSQNIIDGLTVKLNGRRNCRTKIDLDKWKNDYEQLLVEISNEESKLKTNTTQSCLQVPNSKDGTACGWYYVGDYINGEKSENLEHTSVDFYMPDSGARNDAYRILGAISQINEKELLDSEQGDVDTNKLKIQYSDFKFKLLGNVLNISYDARKYITECPCKIVEDPANAEVGNLDNLFAGKFEKLDLESELSMWQLREYNSLCNNGFVENASWAGVDALSTGDHIYRTSMTCNINDGKEGTWQEIPLNKYVCASIGATWDNGKCMHHSLTTTIATVEVTSLKQEVCKGTKKILNTGPIPNACTKTCPVGYRFGTDGYCYKVDTSYLNDLLNQQQVMLDILSECSNLSSEEYKLNTEMTAVFEEPTYGRNVSLNKEKTNSTEKVNHLVYAKDDPSLDYYTRYYANGGRQIQTRKCVLDTLNPYCYYETVDVSANWISQFGKLFEVDYKYTLPTNFNRYVLIPSGKSADNAQSGTNRFGTYQNFINVGFPNYPVNYSTPKGTYNLDVIYKNVGFNDHFTQYINTKIDKNTNIITYDCEYEVKDEELVRCNDPSCGGATNNDESDLGGVRIIYRPISLVNPFPSIDGDGRVTGNNWCSENDCSNVNSVVSKYILNNRGVLYDGNDYDGENIYTQREPMYQITLNPNTIKQIREYNKNTTYDDYNLYCSDGYDCQSTFIKETFNNLFTGCGVSDDFDNCDSLDNYAR